VELLRVLLPLEITNGNTGRGGAFWQTAKLRKGYERDIRNLGHVREPFSVCVDVVYVRILGKRQRLWDASSVLRGTKELEDSLVACGWWHDDGPNWIRNCDGRQDKGRRSEGPAVEIIVSSL